MCLKDQMLTNNENIIGAGSNMRYKIGKSTFFQKVQKDQKIIDENSISEFPAESQLA